MAKKQGKAREPQRRGSESMGEETMSGSGSNQGDIFDVKRIRRLVELMNSGATSSGDLRQEFADIADHLRAENRHVEAVERADDVSIEPPAPERL